MVGFLKTYAHLRGGYRNLVSEILANGEEVSPRGQATREVRGAVIVLKNPIPSLPNRSGRKLNPAIGAAEALQLIGGFSDPRMMESISKNFSRFLDAGVFHGAYGTRLRGQLPLIYERLRDDPDTRQAVVTIWDPLHDAVVRDSKDFPCTITLQFMVRDDALELQTYMRSNDVWLGLPYDAFQFTQLQMTMANVLDLRYGPYAHHVGSLHIYERDVPAALAMLGSEEAQTTGEKWMEANAIPMGVQCPPAAGWAGAQALARAAYEGNVRLPFYSHFLEDHIP